MQKSIVFGRDRIASGRTESFEGATFRCLRDAVDGSDRDGRGSGRVDAALLEP